MSSTYSVETPFVFSRLHGGFFLHFGGRGETNVCQLIVVDPSAGRGERVDERAAENLICKPCVQ